MKSSEASGEVAGLPCLEEKGLGLEQEPREQAERKRGSVATVLVERGTSKIFVKTRNKHLCASTSMSLPSVRKFCLF